MVTTFMPYPSLAQSAMCLDRDRLIKQIPEMRQMVNAFHKAAQVAEPHHVSIPWYMHPATQMWRGALLDLMYAHNVFSDILYARFGITHTGDNPVLRNNGWRYGIGDYMFHGPWWWGNARVHDSHKSVLLSKDADHYGECGWSVPAKYLYIWPRYQPRELYYIDDKRRHVLVQSYEKAA